MRIEYDNRLTDIVRFMWIHQFLSPVIQGFFLLIVAIEFVSEVHHSILARTFSALFLYIVMWIVQLLFSAVYSYSKRNPTVFTQHVIELQEDALLEETKLNKSYFYWPGINKVVSRPGFIAIYVTPSMAHVIPDRAFLSKDQKSQFLSSVSKKIQAARQIA